MTSSINLKASIIQSQSAENPQLKPMDTLIAQYRASLDKLLAAPKLPFNTALRQALPNNGGVYQIIQVEDGRQLAFYVGKTGNLRARIIGSHLRGNSEASTLRRKMIRSGDFADEISVTKFLMENCLIQFLEIEDKKERAWFEHFTIAMLKPKYND